MKMWIFLFVAAALLTNLILPVSGKVYILENHRGGASGGGNITLIAGSTGIQVDDGAGPTVTVSVNAEVCLANGTNCPSSTQGPPGTNGTNGANGTNGTRWYTNASEPQSTLGLPGDFFFRNDTGEIYNKTNSTNWQKIANLTGARGADGSAGSNGAQGPPGSNGTHGTNGTNGLNGTNGINGTNASVTSGDIYLNVTNGVITWNLSAGDARYYLLTNPFGFYNSSTIPAFLTAETDPYWSGNMSTVCRADGTNCPTDTNSGYTQWRTASGPNVTAATNNTLMNWTAGAGISIVQICAGGVCNVTFLNTGVITESDPIANPKFATLPNLTHAQIAAAEGNFTLNASTWTPCVGTNLSVWNGKNFTCTPPVVAPTIISLRQMLTMPMAEMLLSAAVTASPATLAPPGTVRCNTFTVPVNANLTFNNVAQALSGTNTSIGVNTGIYNCTGGGVNCTNGTLLINSSIWTPAGDLRPIITNTTGNWVLFQGNYAYCTATNSTIAQTVFRTSVNLGITNFPYFFNISGSAGGRLPASFTSRSALGNTMNVIGFLYDSQGAVA